MTATESPNPAADEHTADGHDEAHDEHPSDAKYVVIALILGVLTAFEVATYYVDIGSLLVPALLIMMVTKFSIVALYFMHLKFDSKFANRMFLIGIFLAVAVYAGTLSTFAFFGS
jgi:cytochrome c oxidase subunit 4